MKKALIIIGFIFSIFCNAQINQSSINSNQSFINTSVNDNDQNIIRTAAASTDANFYVSGDANTYYPVAFKDNNWTKNKATVLELGRSNVHENSLWNGSLIATFRFHLNKWGHGSSFIDADIKQNRKSESKDMIGGWVDHDPSDALYLVIWLRGAATYYYNSNCTQLPLITNSSITIEGKTYDTKTQKDGYVNTNGETISKNLWVLGSNNYFKGNVGIGTDKPNEKLEVAGVIRAKEVKIEAENWADFVFDKDYKLPTLDEVKAHIDEHKHLPNIPSEKEVQENGIGIGEMQVKLLQKIEELTLYVIQQNKTIEKQEQRIGELEKQK